jgi:hypothetical protein
MEYKRNLKVGVTSYTDDELVLDVAGNLNVSNYITARNIITLEDGKLIAGIGIGTTTQSLAGVGVTTLIFSGNIIPSITLISARIADINFTIPDEVILSDVSIDGLTFYTGKALVGIATTSPSWTICRTLSSSAGIVTSIGIARYIAWSNRTSGIYT